MDHTAYLNLLVEAYNEHQARMDRHEKNGNWPMYDYSEGAAEAYYLAAARFCEAAGITNPLADQ